MHTSSHPSPRRRALLVCLLLALSTSALACKSSPEIPEDGEARTYRSTNDDAEGAGEGSKADGMAAATSAEDEGGDAGAASGDVLKASGDVAIVNSEPITAEQFDAEIDKLVSSGQLPPHILSQIQGQQREQLKAQIVQSMVVRRLLEQEIEKNPIEISQQQIDARVKQMEEELSMASQGRLTNIEEMRKQMGISKEELMKSIKQSLALEALVRKTYNYDEATEADARAYYDEHASDFQQPEQVRARHILIKVAEPDNEDAWLKAKKEIKKVHQKAAEQNADFPALAKEYSEDGSAAQGGDLGYFPRNAMVPEFEKVAFELENGAVSEPFRTQFGWHIVKRVDYRPAGPVPFEQVKKQLTTQLTGMKFQESLERFVTELQQTAKVEMKLDNIS